MKYLINKHFHQKPSDRLQTKLNLASEMISQVQEFGVNILKNDIQNNQAKDESLPPLLMLRNYLDILDSISTLARQGSTDCATILLRASLETSMQLEFLLSENFELKSATFLFVETLKQKKQAEKIFNNSGNTSNSIKLPGGQRFDVEFTEKEKEEYQTFLKEKEEILHSEPLRKIYDEYVRLKQNKESTTKWYKYFNGPSSIEKLANHLKRSAQYEFLYRNWSNSVHGTEIMFGKIHFNDITEELSISPIRSGYNIGSVFQHAVLHSFPIYRIYISTRTPELLETYKDWYPLMKTQLTKTYEDLQQ